MKLLRFSLRALFALIAAVAIVCAVLFAVPEYVRLAALFLGVLAMPGPLAALARSGSPPLRAFGLGGLVSYAAWFVLVGIPAGIFTVNQFGQYLGIPLSGYGATFTGRFGGGLGAGPGPTIVIPSYLLYAGLYAPWISVPAAGLSSLLGQALCGARTAQGAEKRSDLRPE